MNPLNHRLKHLDDSAVAECVQCIHWVIYNCLYFYVVDIFRNTGTDLRMFEVIVWAVSCRLMRLLAGNVNSCAENDTRGLLQVVFMTRRLRVVVIPARHLHVAHRRRLTTPALGKFALGECHRHVSTEMERRQWSDRETGHPCPEARPEVDLPCPEVLVDVAALPHEEAASRGVSRPCRKYPQSAAERAGKWSYTMTT